jgi:hypothetical protein
MTKPRCCEQGYVVFGEAVADGNFLDGHVGVFEGCDGSGNHARGSLQWVWEVSHDQIGAVQRNAFGRFWAQGRFLGIRTEATGLTPVQQQLILESIRSQQGVPSDFFRWKNPGHSFRCDGLVCWAYEEAGIDMGYAGPDQCWPGLLFDRFACIP